MNLWVRLVVLWLTARRRSRVDLLGECVTRFRVAPGDLDALGHVNNGRYLTLLDLARTDLLLRSGAHAVLHRRRWYPVVTAETIAFHRELRLGQPFTVTTRTLGWDDRSILLEQVFRRGRDGSGEVVAEAVVRALFLRVGGGRVPTADLLAASGHDGATSPALPDWAAAWHRAQDDLRAARRTAAPTPVPVPVSSAARRG
ncbi:acyl-CoA thioesterase [Aquipuribacter nitratireducens]|uniref:Acyl-CoA thioesterase n=1 Tax=Aquipuribacter nitratireducens TaxID=650104 RepID=A0ABW0GMY1_9MICO